MTCLKIQNHEMQIAPIYLRAVLHTTAIEAYWYWD